MNPREDKALTPEEKKFLQDLLDQIEPLENKAPLLPPAPLNVLNLWDHFKDLFSEKVHKAFENQIKGTVCQSYVNNYRVLNYVNYLSLSASPEDLPKAIEYLADKVNKLAEQGLILGCLANLVGLKLYTIKDPATFPKQIFNPWVGFEEIYDSDKIAVACFPCIDYSSVVPDSVFEPNLFVELNYASVEERVKEICGKILVNEGQLGPDINELLNDQKQQETQG